jgi:hypothetical protein
VSDYDKALHVCLEYFAHRPGVRARLTDQTNSGLRAQSLEQDRSSGLVREVRCDQHERPIWKCHEKHLPCEAGQPLHTDRTGEAGTSTDPARRLLMDLDRAENALLTDANRLIGHPIASYATLTQVLVRHGHLISCTVRKSARVFDSALGETLGRRKPDPGKAHDGLPGCQSCARLVVNRQPWWSDPNYAAGNPTDLGGMLTEKVRLCRACQRFAVNQEPTRLPTVAELAHRKSDPRGQWPRRYAQVPRAS